MSSSFRLYKRDSEGRDMPPDAPGYRERPWHFRFEFRGKRYGRSTETNVAKDAQIIAARLRTQIVDAVKAQRFADLDATKLRRPAAATVGDVLPLYRQHARVKPRTVENNIGALSLVLRRAMNNPDLDITRVCLSQLTRKLARDFQDATLRTAGDLLARGRAATNANSFLRQARSIFARHAHNDLMAYYQDAGLRLPETLDGFRTASLLKEPSHKFKPAAAETMQRVLASLPSLKVTDPDCYRIFLLAYGCGLRRGEIVHLRGSDIQHAGDRHTIKLERRADWTTKTDEERCVPMEDHVWRELVDLSPMLAAPRSPDPVARFEDYIQSGATVPTRMKHFRRFGQWLTSLGWTSDKKAHQLRKEWATKAVDQLGAPRAAAIAGHSVEVQQAHYYGMNPDQIPTVKIFGT